MQTQSRVRDFNFRLPQRSQLCKLQDVLLSAYQSVHWLEMAETEPDALVPKTT